VRPARSLGSTSTLALALATAGTVSAQTPGGAARGFAEPWPFTVGERAEYDVTFGPVRVGRGRLEVEGVDTLRGTPAYRLAFEIEGGPFFYKIDDRAVSWLATGPYRSLRFEQILHEGGYERHRRYELDHDAGTSTREDWDAELEAYRPHPTERDVPMPAGALDEISYVYLMRTLPLEVGRTYTFEDYFEADGNPVVIQVLRRERVRLRAGTFETVVVRPIIQTEGIFGEGGAGEMYITDDERRLIVLIKTRMGMGELTMYLRDFDTGG